MPFAEAPALYALRQLPTSRSPASHMHIGSQITDLTPFENAFALLSELVATLRARGPGIAFVDLGGGLGIPYRDQPRPAALPPTMRASSEDGRQSRRAVRCFEPGRMIAGNAGVLISRVIYVKQGA